jgi:hypothetical protein
MISEEQLQELFELYDRFHGALDPLTLEALEAERAFSRGCNRFIRLTRLTFRFTSFAAWWSKSARITCAKIGRCV